MEGLNKSGLIFFLVWQSILYWRGECKMLPSRIVVGDDTGLVKGEWGLASCGKRTW
jgi:hypothetical protein